MLDPVLILVALVCGLLSRAVNMPALVGYLAAGFLLFELGFDGGVALQVLAEIGVTLLLFTIGLKLDLRDLLATRVWGAAFAHMGVSIALLGMVLYAVALSLPVLGLDTRAAVILAFALSFSSTVFVIQIMQERGEMASRHARLAIAVLIIQDLVAVVFLVFSADTLPNYYAIGLFLLIPCRRPLLATLRMCGHGELFTLAGFALAFLGAQLFEVVGLKGDLGALVMGALLARDQKAKELAKNLLHFKDLFLVGFFLSIGLGGWPAKEVALLAMGLGVLSVFKPIGYFLLFTRFHVGTRTALLASTSLANHSEFGLIVVAMAMKNGWIGADWGAAISIAIATSFVIAAPVNRYSHALYRRLRPRLLPFESHRLRAGLPDTSNVTVLILGMGNIGTGAYESIAQTYGERVLGIDDNDDKLSVHRSMHRRVAAADASDPDFWHRMVLNEIELVMLALTNHRENLLVVHLLHELGYEGDIAAVVRFEEEAAELEKFGVSAFNLYAQAGEGFALHAASAITAR
ncbi:MAG: cation:proton antiporter [Pseudomonadota bacterium]